MCFWNVAGGAPANCTCLGSQALKHFQRLLLLQSGLHFFLISSARILIEGLPICIIFMPFWSCNNVSFKFLLLKIHGITFFYEDHLVPWFTNGFKFYFAKILELQSTFCVLWDYAELSFFYETRKYKNLLLVSFWFNCSPKLWLSSIWQQLLRKKN
jgi:hypothetical protein